VDLGRGLPGAAFEVSSATGLPAVTIESPSGQKLTTPADPQPPVRQGPILAGQSPSEHKVYVYVTGPAAGTWRITPSDGSPPVTALRVALQHAKPQVSARVLGAGRVRTLTYRARPIAGQQLQFVEDGQDTTHPIGTATSAQGRFRFTPTDGAGRTRRILATVVIDGVPRETLVVAHYKAPAPATPGRPRAIVARRRGGGVSLRWGPARGAASYSIFVTGTDGRRVSYTAGARGRRLTIGAVTPDTGLTVLIRGEAARTHRAGPARRVVIRRR
jgi:hypothetical protein